MLNPKQLPKAFRRWYFCEVETFVEGLLAEMNASLEFDNKFEEIMRRLNKSVDDDCQDSYDKGYAKGITDETTASGGKRESV